MESKIIPADLSKLDEVIEFVDKIAADASFPADKRGKIHLAVEEVFVNIASYAYPSGEGEARISCSIVLDPRRIRIEFSDKGIPFDPLAQEDADTSEEALLGREGGLGILLVKKIMDNVSYCRENGRNILTIEKNL